MSATWISNLLGLAWLFAALAFFFAWLRLSRRYMRDLLARSPDEAVAALRVWRKEMFQALQDQVAWLVQERARVVEERDSLQRQVVLLVDRLAGVKGEEE